MSPLVQPQKEEDDTWEIAKRDVHDNAKSGAGFFCVEAVEELTLAIFLVERARSFRDGIQCGAAGYARAYRCEVGGGEPSRPAEVRRTEVMVIVEVELIVRDGAVRGQVLRRTWRKVVAQINRIRESES